MGITVTPSSTVPSVSVSPFEIGSGGPKIVDNSGVIEFKNNANDALVKVRCLTAVAATDAVTYAQLIAHTGTTASTWQLNDDASGPKIKDSSGVLEVRNSADNAYAIVRGLTPVGNADLVTKLYHDGDDAQNVKIIAIPIADPAGAFTSTATIPANSRILRVDKTISEVFDGTGTLAVGYTGSLSAFAGTSDTDITSATTQVLSVNKASDSSARAVICTIGGTPAQGAGIVYVHYIETTQT